MQLRTQITKAPHDATDREKRIVLALAQAHADYVAAKMVIDKYENAQLRGEVPTNAETRIHIGTDPSVLDPVRRFLEEKLPEYEIELGLIPDSRDFPKP